MAELSYPELIGLWLLGVLIGRAVQNWCNRTGETARLAYRAGYKDGIDKREPEM